MKYVSLQFSLIILLLETICIAVTSGHANKIWQIQMHVEFKKRKCLNLAYFVFVLLHFIYVAPYAKRILETT